jgi:uncharacterized spore protein YtfJ
MSSIAERNAEMLDKIVGAARADAVFSQPVVSGDYTVITASEVSAGGGFGFGMGSDPSKGASTDGDRKTQPAGGGGGGGGGSMGRPVAAIVIGPDGVKVEPVVDATKIALAAIGAWGSMAFMLIRWWSRARKH